MRWSSQGGRPGRGSESGGRGLTAVPPQTRNRRPSHEYHQPGQPLPNRGNRCHVHVIYLTVWELLCGSKGNKIPFDPPGWDRYYGRQSKRETTTTQQNDDDDVEFEKVADVSENRRRGRENATKIKTDRTHLICSRSHEPRGLGAAPLPKDHTHTPPPHLPIFSQSSFFGVS